jgi:ribonuclease HII
MRCGFKHERALRKEAGWRIIAGTDEAGRGPLAGPVVAAAVILPERFRHKTLTDSKQLSEKQREKIYAELTSRENVCWAFSAADCEEIDRINILRASHEAMRRAVAALAIQPEHVLIDGLPVRPFPFPQTAIIKGDACSFSIAAASVIAKVTRDRIMLEMDALYPDYHFAQHKGYSTKLHLERLRVHGPCPIHRRSFLPVSQRLFAFAEAAA